MDISEKLFARAAEHTRSFVLGGNLPSAVLAVGNRQDLQYCQGFGKDGAEDDSLDRKIFLLASITKTFAGVGVARLVDRGMLDYEDRIVKYIPEFANRDWHKKITVGSVMTHSTGLATPDFATMLEMGYGVADSYKCVFDTEMVYEPGARMAYSTYTYQLLNEIVFRLTGMRMGKYLREEVFEPCGMPDTAFYPVDKARAMPVVDMFVKTQEAVDKFAELEASGAGCWSTVRDLYNYGKTVLTPGKLMQPETFEKMIRPQPLPRFNEEGFSRRTWGWNREPQAAFPLMPKSGFYHGGATGGVLWLDPARDFVFVFLSNRWSAGNDQAFSTLNMFYE
jgi:CubicO group peptidase (beta-lactamase class C family)